MEQADHPGRTWARRGDTLLVQQSMPEDILTAYAREAQVLVRAAERSANPARPVQGEAPNSPSKPPLVGQKRDPENGLPVGQPPQQRNWPSDDPFDTWSSRGFRARQATGRRPGSEAAVMPEPAPDSLRSRDDYPRAADGPALLKTGASSLRSSKERARLRSRRLESPFAQALFAAAGGKANSHSCALSPHDRPPRPTRSLDTRRNSDGQRQKLAAQAAWESLRRDEEFSRQVAAAASGRATGDPEQDKDAVMEAPGLQRMRGSSPPSGSRPAPPHAEQQPADAFARMLHGNLEPGAEGFPGEAALRRRVAQLEAVVAADARKRAEDAAAIKSLEARLLDAKRQTKSWQKLYVEQTRVNQGKSAVAARSVSLLTAPFGTGT
mmetsp:Transcript_38855/g.97629  ORF Transcript_38855/g.97629 Transcript_38855/m.97629 type:complete len:381 (+) Transcript_38855:78-1220(+)